MQPHRGTTVLVLGILSIVVCPICGIFAWIMGNKDLAAIAAGQMDPEGLGNTKAGRICGIIGTILGIIGIIFMIIYFVVIGVAIGAAAASGELEGMAPTQ